MKFAGSKYAIAVFSWMVLFTSCVNDDLKEQEANQKRIIRAYMDSHPGYTETVDGIYTLEQQAGTGLAPIEKKYAFVKYTGYFLESGKIRETNDSSLKSEWGAATYFTHYLYGPTKILYGYSMLGINNALAMMKEGGKLSVIIPGEQAMKDYVPMLYNLELIKVIDDNNAYEDTVVHAFLDKNSFTPENQVDTSLWVKIISGDGISTDSAAAGDTVYITYTGRLVDYLYDSVYTRVIDKNSIRYLYNSKILSGQMLSSGNNVMPKCVQLAIDLMKEGDKARILSLYEYAFGKDGIVDKTYKYTVIPKLQTVSYDVEITSIKKK